MSRPKKFLVIGAGLVLILLVAFSLHHTQKPGTLVLDYTNVPDTSNISVKVNGEFFSGRDIYQVSLAPGNYQLQVSKPGFRTFSQSFSIASSQSTSISVSLPPTTKPPASNLDFVVIGSNNGFQTLSNILSPGTTVTNTVYLNDESWAIVTLNIKRGIGFAYYAASYDSSLGLWEVAAGPNDDFSGTDLSTMPLNVQNYIKAHYPWDSD